MIEAVIIEDERKSALTLKKIIENYCPSITIVGQSGTIQQAHKLIRNCKPQLVFLDIEMPDGNAFTLLDYLKPVDFLVIFVTAHSSYSIQAIRYSALDYLLKPVNINELITAVNKANEKINYHKLQERVDGLIQHINSPRKEIQTVAIPISTGYEILQVAEIIRFEAEGSYTDIILSNGRKIRSIRLLHEYDDMLPSEIFFRVHHSFIINKSHIRKFLKGKNASVELSDKVIIPIAQRKKGDFFDYFDIEP